MRGPAIREGFLAHKRYGQRERRGEERGERRGERG
jgi:hypothetical protein